MTVQITPIAVTNIYYKFYIILAVFNVAIMVIVYFFFFETKGLSLEQIDIKMAEKYHGGAELREAEAVMATIMADKEAETQMENVHP